MAALALLATPCASHALITCQVSGSGMNFGSYNVMSLVPLDSVGSITVTCVRNQGQPTASVSVTIGPSQNTGGTNVRKMRQQAGSDLLEYNLFSDPGRNAVWGTGSQGVVQQVTVPPPVGSAQQVFQIYGRIPPAQNVSVGNYSDALTLTVNP